VSSAVAPDTKADVVIVGAGASGAVAARRLASAGVRVVCLEQGDWPGATDGYRGADPEWEITALKQWHPNPNVRAAPADYPVDDANAEMKPLMYNGVGGSTVLYAAQWPRLLPSDFRVATLDGVADDWPISYAELEPFYDRVDQEFGVAGLRGDPAYPLGAAPPLPPLPLGVAGARVARAHNALGWHWWPGPNAIASRAYGRLAPCVQRGVCGWGCPDGAKASTDLTHWPDALLHGATLLTGARVCEITLAENGCAAGVVYIDREGSHHFQPADAVLLAANAIGTARLLLLSRSARFPEGLANRSGLVGRRLMLHPYTRVVGFFDERFDSWQGHWGQSLQSMQFYETDPARDFIRGAKWNLMPTGGPLSACLFPWPDEPNWGEALHRHVARWLGHATVWGITAEDLPDQRNQVTLAGDLSDSDGLPAPKVSYRVSDNSRRILDFNVARAQESLEAAGAVATISHPLMGEFGWHLLGTARMGDDPDASVVDRWGRSHDVPNLYVIDGSTFVTGGSVNPTATIVALALRAADRLMANRHGQRVP
jgi:choline dehydrogenase-like flavoprotein